MYTGNKKFDNFLKKMEVFFERYFVGKAPAIPNNIQEIIVKFGPWLLAISLVLGFLGLFSTLGILSTSFPAIMARGMGNALIILISLVLSIIIFIMEAVALPGLFKRKIRSWYLIYYASLLSAVQAIFQVNLLLSIIFMVLGLYILFQIKNRYS
jgi:hypothetical protein